MQLLSMQPASRIGELLPHRWQPGLNGGSDHVNHGTPAAFAMSKPTTRLSGAEQLLQVVEADGLQQMCIEASV